MAGRRLTRFTVDPVDTNGMLAKRVVRTDRWDEVERIPGGGLGLVVSERMAAWRGAEFSTQPGDQS